MAAVLHQQAPIQQNISVKFGQHTLATPVYYNYTTVRPSLPLSNLCIKLLYKCKHTRIHRLALMIVQFLFLKKAPLSSLGDCRFGGTQNDPHLMYKVIPMYSGMCATANSGFIYILTATARTAQSYLKSSASACCAAPSHQGAVCACVS